MSNDPNQDKRVSDTYRSLASEKVPPQLDRKILEMAAAERSRPLYARWMAWTRPLAWAATITLCLAITLELNRDQTLSPAVPAVSLKPAAQVPKDATAPEFEPESQRESREQDQVLAESKNDSIIAEKTALARSASKQAINEPAPARVRQSALLLDEAVIEVAEEETEKEKAAVSGLRAEASFSAGVIANDSDYEADECAGEARAEAESWLECIQVLEAAGEHAAALRQRDELKETFPDFKLP